MPYKEQKFTFNPDKEWREKSINGEIDLIKLINRKHIMRGVLFAIIMLTAATALSCAEAFTIVSKKPVLDVLCLILRCVCIAVAAVSINNTTMRHKNIKEYKAILNQAKTGHQLHEKETDDLLLFHSYLHDYSHEDGDNFMLMLIVNPNIITVTHDNATPENGRIRLDYEMVTSEGPIKQRFWFKEAFFLDLISLGRFETKPIQEDNDDIDEEDTDA